MMQGKRQAEAGNGRKVAFGGHLGLGLFFPRWVKGLNRGSCRRRGGWRFGTVLQPQPDPW